MEEKGLPRHPRRIPELSGELTLERVKQVFSDCADFAAKQVRPAGWDCVTVCWIDGMVRTERLNDYILRPLSQLTLQPGQSPASAVVKGGVWSQNAQLQRELSPTVDAMLKGCCALFLPDGVVTCMVESEEKRAVSQPDNESEGKGAKDSFVESVRTNTALIRRRLHSPFLRVRREIVGRQTLTPVELLWLENICDPALPQRAADILAGINQEGMLTPAELEEHFSAPRSSAFPRVLFTERPDRVCQGLLEGRVAVMCDGIPLGCVVPVEMGQFLRAPQDRAYHYLASAALNVLRWICMGVTLLLPGFYIAVATFHVELIPTQLAMSIITSERDVPFPVAFEVMGMLVAFEILQEAGLRLPKTIGQTVSIIGGLVVGQAAVEAKIVSPAVVIVVAVAGITGFTIPNQDFANALRLWRLALGALASVLGIFGLTLGAGALVLHLSGLESLSVPYLAWGTAVAVPLREQKHRPRLLHPINRRSKW